MKRIEFGELRIGELGKKNVQECLDANWISMGPKTQELEKKFAKLMDTKYAVATSSGTSSLVIYTLALPELTGRKTGKVIVPALGFIANSTAVVSGGFTPKWVDINPETLNIDEKLVEDAIDDDVVAIYAIGTMGMPAEMDALKDIADRHHLLFFEDSCENYGSKFKGQYSHKYALAGCSSHFQAHLVQAGEGSCIYTDSGDLYDLAKSIRSHGRHPDSHYFEHVRFGSNFKTTDLCSAIALEGIENFHDNIKDRKRVWRSIVDHTSKYSRFAWMSHEPDYMEVMPHGFSITLKPESGYNIESLKDVFDNYNIHWKRNFGFCGSHAALSRFDDGRDMSWAKWCGDNGIHIGTHRFMTQNDIERVCDALDEFFGG